MASASVTRIALKAVIVTFSIPFLEAGSMRRHSRAAALRQHPIRALCLPTLRSRPVCSETIEAEFRFASAGIQHDVLPRPAPLRLCREYGSQSVQVPAPCGSPGRFVRTGSGFGGMMRSKSFLMNLVAGLAVTLSSGTAMAAALGHPTPWQIGLQGAATPGGRGHPLVP